MTTQLQWLAGDAQPEQGLVRRQFVAQRPAGPVPGVLWAPVTSSAPAVVLLGHGGSGHKDSDRLRRLAAQLGRAQLAALAIDGPFHGDRASPGDAGAGYQQRIVALGAGPVMDGMIGDWLDVLDLLDTAGEVAGDRVGVFGLSMGARYGIPVAAALSSRLRCAVFGLFGLSQSPLIDPRMHDAELIAAAARRIAAPLLQHVQWDDEIFPRAGQLDLFDEFATADKQLRGRTGPHTGSDPEDEAVWASFLSHHLSATRTETQ